ncbi:hypothetical protein V2J09_021863 [Rumex salicifolius]
MRAGGTEFKKHILVPAPSTTDRSADNLPATRCHILFARIASPGIRATTHQPPARRPPIRLNQRTPETQSVVSRRRIYYDSNSGEVLICSDSEEERVEDDEEKKEYVQPEDQIIQMTIRQFGLSDDVLHVLGQYLFRKPSEVKERYEILNEGEKTDRANPYLDKDLDAALDSFDNLFCRRCYVKAKVAGKSCTQKMKKKRVSERVVDSMLKKQKKVVNFDCESLFADIHKDQANVEANDVYAGTHDGSKKEEFVDESSGKQEAGDDKSWNPLAKKSLYDKGLEIFGRNRFVSLLASLLFIYLY